MPLIPCPKYICNLQWPFQISNFNILESQNPKTKGYNTTALLLSSIRWTFLDNVFEVLQSIQ